MRSGVADEDIAQSGETFLGIPRSQPIRSLPGQEVGTEFREFARSSLLALDPFQDRSDLTGLPRLIGRLGNSATQQATGSLHFCMHALAIILDQDRRPGGQGCLEQRPTSSGNAREQAAGLLTTTGFLECLKIEQGGKGCRNQPFPIPRQHGIADTEQALGIRTDCTGPDMEVQGFSEIQGPHCPFDLGRRGLLAQIPPPFPQIEGRSLGMKEAE